jgi:hypothetical protein
LPLALAAVPALATTWFVLYHAIDVPYWDEWTFIDHLRSLVEGTYELETLFSSHNGHRIVLPRVVMLALGWASDLDVRWMQVASLLVSLATLWLMAPWLRDSQAPLPRRFSGWLLVPVSAVVFAWSPWSNWTSGWQFQIFFSNFWSVLAVRLALRGPIGWPRVALALLAALGSAFSFASGLVCLPIVALALLMDPRAAGDSRRWLRFGVALATACAAVWSYYDPQARMEQSNVGGPAHSRLLGIVLYVPCLLGGWATRQDWRQASWIGGIGLACVALFGWTLWFRRPKLRPAVLPWVLLSAHAIGASLAVGFGRFETHAGQAMSPRYGTLAVPFWVSLVCVTAMAWGAAFGTRRDHPRLWVATTTLALAISGITIHSLLRASQDAITRVRRFVTDMEHGRAFLARFPVAPAGTLESLFFEDFVHSVAPVLAGERWSTFRRWPFWPAWEECKLEDRAPFGRLHALLPDPRYSHCWIAAGDLDPAHVGETEEIWVTVADQFAGRTSSAAQWELHLAIFSDWTSGSPVVAYAVRGSPPRLVRLEGTLALPDEPQRPTQ